MHKLQKKLVELASREDLGTLGYRKIGEKIGVSHPQQVKWHLQKLLKDGYLVKVGDGSIKVSDPSEFSGRLAKVPILGLANCGEALSFADNTLHGYLPVSSSLIRSKKLGSLFAVQATGDSMNQTDIDGQAIDDGDYCIVDSSVEVPQTGDVVVSSVEGLANVKKYVRDEANQVIALVSESTRSRPPIIIDQSDEYAHRIHGKVIQVIKASNY